MAQRGHFHHSGDEFKASKTPKGWLPVGKMVADLTNEWADRKDIVGYVGPGAGGPAPACFDPRSAEVEVNIEVAFGKGQQPSWIDLTTREGRYEYPRAVGAIIHEAFHAAYTGFDLAQIQKDLNSEETNAFMLLEEGRIEAVGVRYKPKSRPFLKACAMDIVIGDMDEILQNAADGSTSAMAQLVALIYGRVDSGVLDILDVREVTDLLDEFFGLDKITKMRGIMDKFQRHVRHTSAEPLYPLAKEWVALVRETREEKGEPQPEQIAAAMAAAMSGGSGGSGSSGEDGESPDGEGSEGSEGESGDAGSAGAGSGQNDAEMDAEARAAAKEVMDKMHKALSGAADGNAISANNDLADAEKAERAAEEVQGKMRDARERSEADAAAGHVFGGKDSGGGYGRTSSRLVETRQPKPEERVAAVKISRELERAKYHDRVETEVRSVLPPGRLRPRALIQGKAQRERGMLTQAEPWQRTVRKHAEDPNLTVGVIVDISGSMGSAMEPMATTAWVMSEAVRQIQGTCAMIYYGNSCFPTLSPGQHLEKVNVWSAEDGTEAFNTAFMAVDGALNLLHGTGARLLFVCSDGAYTGNEQRAAEKWVKRCSEQGVAVVWLPYDRGDYAYRIQKGSGVQYTIIPGTKSVTEAAQIIGRACADELTRAGK
jgi:hypothetical protein